MHIATLSSKYQITLPRRLVRSLGVEPKQKLILSSHDDRIVLQPLITSLTDHLAGSLRGFVSTDKRGVPFAAIRRATQHIVARKRARQLAPSA